MRHRWSFLSVLRRGWEVLRNEGPKSLWFKVLGEICYRRVVVLDLPLDTLRKFGRSDLSTQTDLLTDQNIDDYVSLRPDADPDDIRWRLRNGLSCRLGRYQEEVVHASWSVKHRARIDYLDLEIGLAPGVLYSYEAYVKPAFRRKGFGSQIAWQGTQHAQRAGYSRIVVVVMPENSGAVKYHLKNGYRVIGWIQSFRLGSWRHNRLVARKEPLPISLV